MTRPAARTEAEIAERNAEARALGDYARFLYRRFQKLDIVELLGKAEAAEPISLRQVYVPVRLGKEDLADEFFGEKVPPNREKLPGRDAWDVLASDDFVILAGRPGSGKTTLVHAVVMELCGDRPSALRDNLRALPLPLILRDLGELAEVKTLDVLLERFWQRFMPQATEDGFLLDQPRLEKALLAEDPSARERQALLLFDGIDEIGGKNTRQQLLGIAAAARRAGHRVILTGRPEGYRDLEVAAVGGRASYMLPFAWPQIRDFIGSWYGLRGDWQEKRRDGVARFLEQIGHADRRKLLVLARRPIFLTLMALVHCTENEMPAGRASLYRKIVDLYLERQRKYRYLPQNRRQLSGYEFEDWPENEIRLALAHLAWRSQMKASGVREAWKEESRRVVWDRAEALEILKAQLESGQYGRFTALEPKDADELLQFFLHPAGLLVEPVIGRVQFAHLSFQEFLCAYYIHERFKVLGFEYLEGELWRCLARPGWQEIGLLFLYIHSEWTNHEGHFQLLDTFDLADGPQAYLYVAALSGNELSFQPRERRDRLAVALTCALLHPRRELGTLIGKLEEWRGDCRAMVLRMFELPDPANILALLLAEPSSGEHGTVYEKLSAGWLMPKFDRSWDVYGGGAGEVRAHSLIGLAADLGIFSSEDPLDPIADPQFEAVFARWLARQLGFFSSLLWERRQIGPAGAEIPMATIASFQLDRIVPSRGPLFEVVAAHMPSDVVLLQGEAFSDDLGQWISQPCVRMLFATSSANPRLRWISVLYESLLLTEVAAEGSHFSQQERERLRSQSLSQSLSQSQSQAQSPSRSYLRSHSRRRSWSLSQSQSLSRSLSRSLSLSLSLSLSESRSRAGPLLRSLTQPHSLSLSLSRVLPFSEGVLSTVNRLVLSAQLTGAPAPETTFIALSVAGLRFAARDYFAERREKPERILARGMAINPLPQELGFFEQGGVLKNLLERRSFVALRQLVEDFAGLVHMVFPEGLSETWLKTMRTDWETLCRRPWSPQVMIDALLMDWPESETSRDVSWEAAEKMVLDAVETDLARQARKKPKMKRH